MTSPLAGAVVVVGMVIAISAVGAGSIALRLRRNLDSLNFATVWRNNLHEWFSEPAQSEEAYTLLVSGSLRMQNILDDVGLGRMDYKPPFMNYVQRNVSIVPTLLQEARRSLDGLGSPAGALESAKNLDEYVLMARGVLDRSDERFRGLLRNPIHWLREGFATAILVPLFVGLIGF